MASETTAAPAQERVVIRKVDVQAPPADVAQAARQAEQAAVDAAQAAEAAQEASQSARDAIRTAIQNAVRRGEELTPEQQRELERSIEEAVEGAENRSVVRVETGAAPPVMFEPRVPPEVVPISISFFVAVAATIIFTPLMRALARRMDRKGETAAVDPQLGGRLERIEHAVDAIAVEVERLGEGQRYSTRLLGEMRGLGAAVPVSRDGANDR